MLNSSDLHEKLNPIAIDRARAKRGLASFIKLAFPLVEPSRHLAWNWHIDAMAEHLQAVSDGDIRNLLIVVPPGCMKTLTVSVFWPAWDWIAHPERTFIFASYGQSLSDKAARQHRDLIGQAWYKERWELEIPHESVRQVRYFRNNRGGQRFSTSVEGEITGRHADVLIFDDLLKVQDAHSTSSEIERANDFWFTAMASRVADPAQTRKVGISQRLH